LIGIRQSRKKSKGVDNELRLSWLLCYCVVKYIWSSWIWGYHTC